MGSEPPPPHPVYVYVPRPNDNMAIAAMVLGILAMFGTFCYGVPALILGPVAIYLGLSARRRIRESGGVLGGEGFAMAGWIVGLVATILGAVYLLFMVAFFGFFFWVTLTHPFPSPTPAPTLAV